MGHGKDMPNQILVARFYRPVGSLLPWVFRHSGCLKGVWALGWEEVHGRDRVSGTTTASFVQTYHWNRASFHPHMQSRLTVGGIDIADSRKEPRHNATSTSRHWISSWDLHLHLGLMANLLQVSLRHMVWPTTSMARCIRSTTGSTVLKKSAFHSSSGGFLICAGLRIRLRSRGRHDVREGPSSGGGPCSPKLGTLRIIVGEIGHPCLSTVGGDLHPHFSMISPRVTP